MTKCLETENTGCGVIPRPLAGLRPLLAVRVRERGNPDAPSVSLSLSLSLSLFYPIKPMHRSLAPIGHTPCARAYDVARTVDILRNGRSPMVKCTLHRTRAKVPEIAPADAPVWRTLERYDVRIDRVRVQLWSHKSTHTEFPRALVSDYSTLRCSLYFREMGIVILAAL
jgi:hypothetical protein